MAQVSVVRDYPSREEAEAAAQDYERGWPPQGYGTSTAVYPIDPAHPEGRWNMSATRWDSCD